MNRAVAFIDKNNFSHNLRILNKLSNSSLMVLMVKANAYGHGLYEIMKLALENNIHALGVACLSEGLYLRERGYQGHIYLFSGGSWLPYAEHLVENQITPMISSIEEFLCLKDYLDKRDTPEAFNVHLDIDTGLLRDGIWYEDLAPILELISCSPKINLEGIFTHFASADDDKNGFTNMQIERFTSVIKFFHSHDIKPKYLHMASSAGVLGKKIAILGFDETSFLSRVGISAYGLSPIAEYRELFKPIMSIKAKIVSCKRIYSGQGVGYSHTFIADKDTDVALISIGYGDGINRALSNKGHVIIDGIKAPIIGTISMDFLMVDVTLLLKLRKNKESIVNTFATLLGEEGEEKITAYEMAAILQTIPYEITTSISKRVKREVAISG